MSLHTSTGKPTKAQAARFVAIKLDTGCVCCRIVGFGYVEPDIQHINAGSRRKGHDDTYGCCPWHHRGVLPPDRSAAWMRQYAGPSLAHGSKPFHAFFGSDDELLARQNELLGSRRAA